MQKTTFCWRFPYPLALTFYFLVNDTWNVKNTDEDIKDMKKIIAKPYLIDINKMIHLNGKLYFLLIMHVILFEEESRYIKYSHYIKDFALSIK